MNSLAVKGAQAAAGLVLTASASFYLFLSALSLGSLGSGEVSFISIPTLVASAASLIFIISTILKFRIWVPAVVGGGVGLVAMTGFVIVFLIVYFFISFMGGIAASGGQ